MNSNKDLNELDHFFAGSLKDASVDPEPQVWDNIETHLNKKSRSRFLFRLIPVLLLISGTITTTYFFIPKNYFTSHSKINNTAITETKPQQKTETLIETKEQDQTAKETKVTETTAGNISNENAINKKVAETEIKTENKNVSKKIQIAALKNSSANIPSSISGMEVKSEIGNDGLTRYFVESNNNIEHDLSQIKSNGFPDAFVMKAVSPSENTVTKNNSNLIALNKKQNSQAANNVTEKPVYKNNSPSVNMTKKTAPVLTTETKPVTEVATKNTNVESTESKSANIKTEMPTETKPEVKNSEPIVNANNTSSNTNTPIEDQKTEVANTSQTSPTIAPAGKDSVVKETPTIVAKVDSSSQNNKIKTTDSIKPKVPFDRFGLYVLGGAVYSQALLSSNAHNIRIESYPITFNAGLKFQVMATRRLAIELGANYQSAAVSTGTAPIWFQKLGNADSHFYTAFGEMAVSHSDMIIGYSTMAPVDSFPVRYEYKINYNVLNVPLLVKFYPVKKDKLSISVSLGMNSQFILDQSSQVTLHKEFHDEVYKFNNVIANKFNFGLLFGLGCEIKLYKNIYFVAEPNFRYGLSNMSNSSGTRSNVINIDGNAGIKIGF